MVSSPLPAYLTQELRVLLSAVQDTLFSSAAGQQLWTRRLAGWYADRNKCRSQLGTLDCGASHRTSVFLPGSLGRWSTTGLPLLWSSLPPSALKPKANRGTASMQQLFLALRGGSDCTARFLAEAGLFLFSLLDCKAGRRAGFCHPIRTCSCRGSAGTAAVRYCGEKLPDCSWARGPCRLESGVLPWQQPSIIQATEDLSLPWGLSRSMLNIVFLYSS